MRFKPKYYIVHLYSLSDEITWPEGWGNRCPANLIYLLREQLKNEKIGGEIKCIWNDSHRMEILRKYEITYEQLDNYLKADCTIISFQSKGTRKRALKFLENHGAKSFICVDNYRDVLTTQAYYSLNNKFPE